MSTKNIQAVLAWAARGDSPDELAAAVDELEAIEKAAAALVDWTNKGQPRTHLDAARGYDILERVATSAPKVDTPPE